MEHQQHTEPETKKVRPDSEVNQALERIRRYAPSVVIGLLTALVVVLLFTFHRQRQEAARDLASAMFIQARTIDDFQAVVTDHPHSPEAPMALLALAAQRFQQGRVDEAEQDYLRFLSAYPTHPMRPMAELGLAYCAEAAGRLQEAAKALKAFLDAQGDHYLKPVALLAHARVLAADGHVEEARAIYATLLEDPDHPWFAQARTDSRHLEMTLRSSAHRHE